MKRFLLIDEDRLEYMYVNYLFKNRYEDGFTIAHARTVDEANAHLSQQGVDTILLNDKLDGVLTADKSIPMIQRTAVNVPIILMAEDIHKHPAKDRSRFGSTRVVDKYNLKDALARGCFD